MSVCYNFLSTFSIKVLSRQCLISISFLESWNTEKNTHRLARLQKFVSPEKTGPVPTTESSSNETLYTHSSEETTTDVSSEEVEQKESEDEFIEAGANGSEEDGHEEYEHQEDDANEEEIVDDGERSEGSNGTFVDEEYAEEVEPEKGVEEVTVVLK